MNRTDRSARSSDLRLAAFRSANDEAEAQGLGFWESGPAGPVGGSGAAASGSTPPTDRLARLSPAERVVAELVAEGRTNREIGESLYVSRRTVESHITHAFQKLDVRSRTQLAAIVLTERRR